MNEKQRNDVAAFLMPRLLTRVEVRDDHLIWLGPVNTHTCYPIYNVRGRQIQVRRWLFEHVEGQLKPSERTLPGCGITACVRPDHVEVITLSELTKRSHARRVK